MNLLTLLVLLLLPAPSEPLPELNYTYTVGQSVEVSQELRCKSLVEPCERRP